MAHIKIIDKGIIHGDQITEKGKSTVFPGIVELMENVLLAMYTEGESTNNKNSTMTGSSKDRWIQSV